ncbi:dihydropteroate synthase, partial [Candidatus Peregrinibacteria bacterium CG10_big_fil_rev_8_21_14_0_10_49_10]
MSPFKIVGILNTTPDSYFDGGQFNQVDTAVKRAGEMLAEGADIIEVGGESTGPGSRDVSLEEERERTMSIIQAILKAYPDTHV